MKSLEEYFDAVTSRVGLRISHGELFAKILTPNDDSGRHGVLIPNDAYPFFPALVIPDPSQNTTGSFECTDVSDGSRKLLSYKYYQRYPERRVTRLNPRINDVSARRLVVFLKGKTAVGSAVYLVDFLVDNGSTRFSEFAGLLFGNGVPLVPGLFVQREIGAQFQMDSVLQHLLDKFDGIKARGWIPSLRTGTTGIGYTFESLVGVVENNDRIADFHGIEIKCSLARDTASSGKINLFQQAPTWRSRMSAKERIEIIGTLGDEGRYSCHSQVTARANNLGLRLDVCEPGARIDLMLRLQALGDWTFSILEKRLQEKHSRAVFIKAKSKTTEKGIEYKYTELTYCEKPSISQFINLVASRDIVFEFMMSQKKPAGSVRNHGYPWRLARSELLEQLFGLKVGLRL